ncbi:hypothetical protein, partial [uncultured Paracoccus sp.]|uniref:hypothetical protein n=1 Tax=uncultured Paracoccus sp. TaxID=189685 RepID=UPI002607846D
LRSLNHVKRTKSMGLEPRLILPSGLLFSYNAKIQQCQTVKSAQSMLQLQYECSCSGRTQHEWQEFYVAAAPKIRRRHIRQIVVLSLASGEISAAARCRPFQSAPVAEQAPASDPEHDRISRVSHSF